LAQALPSGPVLSEDPLVPLVAGRRPVLLDAWMLRLAAERDPRPVEILARDLARGAYAAVVLFRDLDDPAARGWYDRGNLGLAVVDAVRGGYRPAGRFGRYHLYVPRTAPVPAPGATAIHAAGTRERVVAVPQAR
jgi:hypothetical protein